MTSYDIASYDSCEPKRFSRRCNKVERKHVQEQQPNKIHFYNQNMGFVNRMDQSVANYKIGTQMKKWWWYPFVWMLVVVLQGVKVLHRINRDEGDESLPFLVFWRHIVNVIFLKYSKEGRLSLSQVGIRNISSDVCYHVTKHYQVESEHRCTQNLFKHLRWGVFVQTVNTLNSLTRYAKTLHPRCLEGFWICLCCKTRQVWGVQKRTLDAAAWNINLRDVYFETFQWY